MDSLIIILEIKTIFYDEKYFKDLNLKINLKLIYLTSSLDRQPDKTKRRVCARIEKRKRERRT